MQNTTKSRKQIKAIRAKSQKWYYSEKGKAYRLRYSKEYYRANKKHIRARNNEWIRKNKARHDKARKRYSRLNVVKERLRSREWRRVIRTEVLDLLGGVCCKCGFDDRRALQIDHVKGGGLYDYNRSPGGVYLSRVKRHIKRGGKKYQLLCANCNWIKRNEQKEFGGRIAK